MPYIWGCSSAGRAAALQAVGSGFESCHLHQLIFMRQHQSSFARGCFVVGQDLLINRLFIKKFIEFESALLVESAHS
jgi:hypothetical protein